jgi:hypothetical protein
MEENQELRKKIIADFRSILRRLSKSKISQIFEADGDGFQLPRNTPIPKQFTDRYFVFYLKLILMVVEKIGHYIQFDFENDRILVDYEGAINALELDKKDLKILKNASRNSTLLKKALEEPGGKELLAALVVSYQKNKNFRHSKLYAKIMCGIIGGRLKKETVTYH